MFYIHIYSIDHNPMFGSCTAHHLLIVDLNYIPLAARDPAATCCRSKVVPALTSETHWSSCNCAPTWQRHCRSHSPSPVYTSLDSPSFQRSVHRPILHYYPSNFGFARTSQTIENPKQHRNFIEFHSIFVMLDLTYIKSLANKVIRIAHFVVCEVCALRKAHHCIYNDGNPANS